MKIKGKILKYINGLSITMAVLFFAITVSVPCSAADGEAVYSTKDGTWEQVDDTTWTMDKDGDGQADITLVKDGDKWKYLFNVEDPDAEYYAWEENVPDGYEIVDGTGGRPDPVRVNPVEYTHTPNISDDGTQNGFYANSLSLNDVVTIRGAKKLSVTITYSTEGISYDWACAWQGNHPDYTAYDNWKSSITGKLGGSNKTTETYKVEGDTVTFGFTSNKSIGGYGYYAVVKGIGTPSEITNRHTEETPVEYGGFRLTKRLAGNAADASRNFRFDISLSAGSVDLGGYLKGTHTFGDVTFRDGSGIAYLKGGESVTLSGIPSGISWDIEESGADGYRVSWSGGTEGGSPAARKGTIEANKTENIICTNTRDETAGDLAVRKETVGGDRNEKFSFSAAFWNLKPDREYSVESSGSTATFRSDANGLGFLSFSLADGQTAVFNGLPVGCQYQVKESESDYIASYVIRDPVNAVSQKKENAIVQTPLSTEKETLDEGEAAEIIFTNKRQADEKTDTIDIPVQKVWVDNNNLAGKRPEYITVDLIQNGEAIASAKLDELSGWKTVFEDLDKYQWDGMTPYEYSIQEADVPDYRADIRKEDDGSYTVTNTSTVTGDLKVAKLVTGADADTELAFSFTVTLEAGEQPLSGTYTLKDTDGSEKEITLDGAGQASFMLKDKETVEIRGIPTGTSYTVVETPCAGYTASHEGIYTGTIPQGETEEVTVVNTTGDVQSLTVSKTVAGSRGDKTRNFHFRLGLSGAAMPDVLPYTKGEEAGTMTVENGAASFTLSHGETIIFENLPSGIAYEVTETDGEASGYKVETVNAEGILNNEVTVSFTNTKNGTIPTSGDTNIRILLLLAAIAIVGMAWFLNSNCFAAGNRQSEKNACII